MVDGRDPGLIGSRESKTDEESSRLVPGIINELYTSFHSFAGIGIPKIYTDFRKMKSNKNIKKKWENLKVLVLDEVSMISGEFFDSLSTVVSDIRKDPRPFGGIQLIVCGDFLQLSPIAPPQVGGRPDGDRDPRKRGPIYPIGST